MKRKVEECGTQHKIKPQSGVLPKILEIEKGPTNNRISYIKLLKVLNNLAYFFLLFVLNIILLVQVYKCCVHYLEGPTYVETKIVPQWKALFPAMTICGAGKDTNYKKDVLKVYSCYRNNFVKQLCLNKNRYKIGCYSFQ